MNGRSPVSGLICLLILSCSSSGDLEFTNIQNPDTRVSIDITDAARETDLVKDDSKSSVPVIGYTVPYAIGNVLLTVWGALIVSFV